MKKSTRWVAFLALVAPLTLAGCGDGLGQRAQAREAPPDAKPTAKAAEDKETEDAVKASLAKLSPEDRKLAEAQRWCAIDTEHRLGEMGVPVKVMVKDQPVFLCCKGCRKAALAEPDETLAKVKELQAKAKAEKAKAK